KLIVAFLPTGIIGLLFYNIIKQYLFESTGMIVSTLLVGGVLLIIFEKFFRTSEGGIDDLSQISYKQCLAIGTFQALAIVPGVSRSAATIIGGMALGLKRKTIVEFSFLLAVPTMFAASGFDLIQTGSNISNNEFGLLAAGFVVSFIVAWLSIKFLLSYVRRHDFTAFGIYRIVIAVLFFLLFL
ncbi:MAG TPA: undecaprenyl-diphosphate phosphatase, partial [Flavobacterium sp.]|nr:undecaprenyl-diphosphate phosphatase [Flavobacterium sp.]